MRVKSMWAAPSKFHSIARVRLVGMYLLNLVDAFVKGAVDCRSYGECTTDDGTQADEEAGEGLVANLAVYNLHW